MLGGLLIGLAEAFSAAYISSTFQDLIVFSLLIAVMARRVPPDATRMFASLADPPVA